MKNLLSQTTDTTVLEAAPILRARQQYLARLFRAFRIAPEEFAVLTVASIFSAARKPLVYGTLINSGIFGITAAQYLTATSIGLRSDTQLWTTNDLGPYSDAVFVVAQWLNQRQSGHSEVIANGMPRGELSIEWGAECQALLEKARRKSSKAWQPILKFEKWWGAVDSLVPHTARWMYGLAGFVAGAILTWLLKP